ncbi:MAG: hypothetical protein JW987_13840 [Anaerolineaceae bacterium]|nr:hypothetical protein [Anaerolineaceae bacterium]
MAQLERSFKVNVDEGELQRRLAAYAGQAGFTSQDGRTYRRGIGVGNLLAAYPRNTPTELNVTWRRDPDDWQLNVDTRINVGGRGMGLIVPEIEYWSAELDTLEKALTGRMVDLKDLKNYAQSVVMRRLLIGLVIVFCIVLGGTLSRMLFETPAAFWMGGAIGGMLGIGAVRPLTRRPIRKPLGSVIKDLPAAPFRQPDASLLEMAMRRDIRSWGSWMIVMGIISFVSAGFLDSAWGILLVVVGLGSLIFRTPALYIVYGVTLVWAAVNNALGSSGTWAVFALVQLVMAVQTFGQFRKFNQAYQAGQRKTAQEPAEAVLVQEAKLEYQGAASESTELDAQAQPDPTEQVVTQEALEAARATLERPLIKPDPNASAFTWLSLAMGFFGLFSLVALLSFSIFQGIFVQAANISEQMIGFLTGVAIDFCLLGFSTGLGSLLARHRFKGAAIAGLILGGLGIGIILTLMVLARLG